MTKQDFELIASVIRAYRGRDSAGILDGMTKTFAAAFADTNPRFDEDRFISATQLKH